MPVRALGVVRVDAHYHVFGRAASMGFYFGVPTLHVPTAEDTFAIASNYVSWERGLFGHFDGYSMARSSDSDLYRTTAVSIDPRGEAFLNIDLATVDGETSPHLRKCIPSTLSPIVKWRLSDDAQRMEGRTYAVGYAIDQAGTDDLMSISTLDSSALTTVMDELRAFMLDNGAQMMCLRTRRGGQALPVAEAYPVVACSGVEPLLGSQRRRTFRGR